MLSGLEFQIEHDTMKFITTFAAKVANEYNINKDDILKIWNKLVNKDEKPAENKKRKSVPKPAEIKDEVIFDKEDLIKISGMNRDGLVAVCKQRGLKVSGKKDELLKRIIEHAKMENPNISQEKPAEKKVKSTKKLIKNKEDDKKVLKAINAITPIIQIRRNRFGNYEHGDSGLIFDRDDQVVIGKQNHDGCVLDLTDEDISLCKKFKFNYKLPENLDKYKKTADVKIKEMEEEELNDEDYKEDEIESEGDEEEDASEEENYE